MYPHPQQQMAASPPVGLPTSTGHVYLHQLNRLIPICLMLIIFILMLIINALQLNSGDHDLFDHAINFVSDAKMTGITPSNWTFGIWVLIFLWLLMLVLYIFAGVFRQGFNGYLYYSPNSLHFAFFYLFIFNNMGQVAWIITFDREKFIFAWVILAGTTISAWLLCWLAFVGCHYTREAFRKCGMAPESEYHVAFINNGIALYTTWITCVLFVQMALIMCYEGEVSREDAATISLVVMMAIMLAWLIFDAGFLDAYTRWVLTPYVVLIFFFSGMVHNKFNDAERNSVIMTVNLSLACVMFTIKIIMAAIRQCWNPLVLHEHHSTPHVMPAPHVQHGSPVFGNHVHMSSAKIW